MNAKELKEAFAEHGIRRVKVGGYDVDGILRGKYLALDKFWGALEEPIGFCDVIFGWDAADVLYDNARVTGWHTGYPDTRARIDPSTFRVLPWEPHTAAFLMDFVLDDGSPHPACPRGLLKNVIARARALGFEPVLAAEFEFFVFRETPASLHAKGFRGLEPLSPGMFGYSWLREGQHADLCHAILDDMGAFGIPIEGLHTETGPGVYEVAIRYDDALRAADKAALFKTAMKVVASRLDCSVTFMAKWNRDLPGSSGHVHQSLWRHQENAFYDAGADGRLSTVATQYLAGQLTLMPELTALISPTVNSYKRYVPGVWAPLNASWGVENRTCAIRAIPGSAKSTRLEHRQTAADINPYVAMATLLAAGLWGIEQKKAAPPPVQGDASERTDLAPLPRTLREATERLDKSQHAKALLGAAFVDHYVRTRDWEARQYERAVTEWELARYFEAI
ncbi:MAG TPA: glutamine synthetase family protein [Polyangiaceae bacterium]|nr:glutamine synthetase family protein [Polyangiaceae bacterium]